MRVASIQMSAIPKDLDRNASKAEELVRKACKRGAELVVLPEHYSVGHFYRNRMDFCQSMDGPLMGRLIKLCSTAGVYVIAPFLESLNGHCLCSAAMIGPHGVISKCSKQILVGAEKVLYASGPESGIFSTEFGRIGIFLGYDISSPGLVSRYEGVDLAVIVCALPRIDLMPWLEGQTIEIGRVLPLSIAMQLMCPLILASLYGPLRMIVPSLMEFRDYSEVIIFDTRFFGKSLIADYNGNVLVEAGEQGESVLVADVDLEMARSFREMMLSEESVEIMRRNIFES